MGRLPAWRTGYGGEFAGLPVAHRDGRFSQAQAPEKRGRAFPDGSNVWSAAEERVCRRSAR